MRSVLKLEEARRELAGRERGVQKLDGAFLCRRISVHTNTPPSVSVIREITPSAAVLRRSGSSVSSNKRCVYKAKLASLLALSSVAERLLLLLYFNIAERP